MKPRLFFWLMRRLMPVNVVAATLAATLTLVVFGPLYQWREWPAFLILIHSIAITYGLGHFVGPEFAWLHGRGYSRDALWAHTTAAAAAAALAAWLPAALIVLTPARSLVQDQVFRSPWYPIMQPRDAAEVWRWLGMYGALLPVLAYGWIRRAQPTQGGAGGWLLTIGAVLAGASLLNTPIREPWFGWIVYATWAVVAAICLVAGRLLYRTLEMKR